MGNGFAPQLHVGARATALTWPSGPGVAIRAAGATTWQATRAPLTPQGATFARDGSLVVAGVTAGAVVAWSRLGQGDARWSALRIESSPTHVFNPKVVGMAPSPAGPLATMLWTASVRIGHLGMPAGGAALQYAELSPTSGIPPGATPRLRLPSAPITTPANAVVTLSPTFGRYTGPTPVQVQIRRGTTWRRLVTLTAENEQAVHFRLTRPGTGQLRLAYGPRFRLATNAVRVRVLRTRLLRIVAGWRPKAVSAVGRDLWVLSGTRAMRSELRLLDARTGRLRRGPIRIAVNPYLLEFVNTGARVLLRQVSSGALRVLDPGSSGLMGAGAALTGGSCDATACTPMTLTIGTSIEHPSRSVGYVLEPVTGPDGRVWGVVPQGGTTASDAGSRLVEGRTTGPPVDHGPVGSLSGDHATGTLVAVDGGVWARDAGSAVSWFGAAGPGVGKGTFAVLAGRGRCVAGLSTDVSNPRVVRLGEGATPNGPGVNLGGTYIEDPVDAGNAPPVFTVGSGTGWVIGFNEQTLIRVPVPTC